MYDAAPFGHAATMVGPYWRCMGFRDKRQGANPLGIVVYIVALFAGAAIFGAFVQDVLAAGGYVVGLDVSFLLTGGAATLYLAVEMGCLALMRFLKPSKGPGLYLAEALSHGATLVLLPFILNWTIDWPHPLLAKAAPLIFIGVFTLLHGFLKLFAFFSALQSRPSHRWSVLVWGSLAWVCGMFTWSLLTTWVDELKSSHPQLTAQAAAREVGDATAEAIEFQEGAAYPFGIGPAENPYVMFRLAKGPDTSPGLNEIFFSVEFPGNRALDFGDYVTLQDNQWVEVSMPAKAPEGVTQQLLATWTEEKPPVWEDLTGVRAVVRTQRKVLLSGPFVHEQRMPESRDPNIIVVLVDGLGSNHVSAYGYSRRTTPALDRLAGMTLSFANVFTPAPEPAAAVMTLFTAVNPLRHGYLEGHKGPLPAEFATMAEVLRERRYATVAFTEGDQPGDLVYGSGFERGFEIFDSSYREYDEVPSEPAIAPGDGQPLEDSDPGAEFGEDEESATLLAGGAHTLEKARSWIEANLDKKFFMFIRLSELNSPAYHEAYGSGYISNAQNPRPVDVYDTTVAYLDRQLGGFTKFIRDYETRESTVVVVTSSYGQDFRPKNPGTIAPVLTDERLRVPLFIQATGLANDERPHVIALEDVPRTLLMLANTSFPTAVNGQSFLEGPTNGQPVSMYGSPLSLSSRGDSWRYVWDTQWMPFAKPDAAAPTEGSGVLYNVDDAARRGYIRNIAAQYPDVVRLAQERLTSYYENYSAGW